MEPKACLNVVFLKTKGAGKSTSVNTPLGQQAFKSEKSSKSITQDGAVHSISVCGFPVTVYDTPGLSDTDMSEDEIQQTYEKVFQKCETGPCVFLLAIKAEKFTQEMQETVEKIEKLLGGKRLDKTWILFTNGELEKENMTIKEFIDDSEPLKNLVQKYKQRCHVFNDKSEDFEAQYRVLLLKMIQTSSGLKPSEGGRLTRLIPAIENSAPDEQNTPVSSLSSRRIVLLGKTGSGKSAAGNTILGQKVFKSVMRMSSVTSECSEKQATVSGRSVTVVDTPGFFDTKMKHEELMKAIARSVYISSPGPHAFLIVFPVNMRFTEQEEQITEQVEMLFGEEVLKYSIILFTYGDMLEEEPVEEIIKDNCKLRHLVQECGSRFHVFNNKDHNRDQVNDLLKKIDTMIKQNGGRHYSNQMFEDAQRFKQEEEKRRQREEEQRKLQVEKQRIEEITTKLKFEAQHDNEFNQFYKYYENRFSILAFAMTRLEKISLGACIGGAFGGLLGLIGGPAGVVAGAAAGAALGAFVSL